ncbi:Uncharacterised protein [Achromobacter xylosoxidans]|nr:hypothetical protein [Achromobacter xylosoxidans]QQE56116.1 hypothetical protein I6H41_24835 [Achromobacter xylosoxidans]CUI27471.1 Uncharacterised protein [Achromobacter xylosoxidans]
MQRSAPFPIVKLPTVEEWVESVASIFGISIEQDQKLTIARTYAKMQDRYAHLDAGGPGRLIEALAGVSIYPDEKPAEELQRFLSREIANLQQVVSWIRSCLVYKTPDQGRLYQDLLLNIVSPQLALLLADTFHELPEHSPLKHLDRGALYLTRHDHNPVIACKVLLRELLDNGVPGLKLSGLAFRKSLNALDDRSSKTASVQRRELKDLDIELGALTDLEPDIRRNTIAELTGAYSAMMAFKRLEKIVNDWHPDTFARFISQLLDDMTARVEARIPDELPQRLAVHGRLVQDLNRSVIEQTFCPLERPTQNTVFLEVLDLCDGFSCTDEPEPLRSFLKHGLDESTKRETLEQILRQLETVANRPYARGIREFVLGSLALSDNNIVSAAARFSECVAASEQWPLGIFQNQSAMLCLGIKLSSDGPQTPQAVNPLLTIYLSSLPQEYVLIVEPDISETTEALNLRELIRNYNKICRTLCQTSLPPFINPLRKIENYLGRIFSTLDDEKLTATEAELRRVSRQLTGQRERTRVKSDYIGTSLYDSLTRGGMTEALLYFDVQDLAKVLPSLCRYTELTASQKKSIIDAVAATTED